MAVIVLVMGPLALLYFSGKYLLSAPRLRRDLRDARSTYLATEGDKTRGAAFEGLALILQDCMYRGLGPYTPEDIRHYLGEPDAEEGSLRVEDGSGKVHPYHGTYWYLYKKPDGSEWAVTIDFRGGQAGFIACGPLPDEPVTAEDVSAEETAEPGVEGR